MAIAIAAFSLRPGPADKFISVSAKSVTEIDHGLRVENTPKLVEFAAVIIEAVSAQRFGNIQLYRDFGA